MAIMKYRRPIAVSCGNSSIISCKQCLPGQNNHEAEVYYSHCRLWKLPHHFFFKGGIRSCYSYARRYTHGAEVRLISGGSQSGMQLTVHATRTPHGASRLVHAMSAWSVKPRRAPSRPCTDARVHGLKTTAMHGSEHPPPPTAPHPTFHARNSIEGPLHGSAIRSRSAGDQVGARWTQGGVDSYNNCPLERSVQKLPTRPLDFGSDIQECGKIGAPVRQHASQLLD